MISRLEPERPTNAFPCLIYESYDGLLTESRDKVDGLALQVVQLGAHPSSNLRCERGERNREGNA